MNAGAHLWELVFFAAALQALVLALFLFTTARATSRPTWCSGF